MSSIAAEALLLAARPKTLPAAVCPVVAGSAFAWQVTHQFSWLLAVCTLLSTIAIQVATNYFNDAVDAAKGADTAARLGPVRATAAGLVSRRTMMMAGIGAVLAAALFSIPLLHARGWPILGIGVASLLFSYGYTGGPWPLAYRGLGEVFVLLFFGLVAVTGTVFVISGEWRAEALLPGVQIGSLSTALIAINNLRDIEEDTRSGKRTIAVRAGKSAARIMITGWCLLPYALGFLWLETVGLYGPVTEVASWKDTRPDVGAVYMIAQQTIVFLPALCWTPLPAVLIGLVVIFKVWRTEPLPAYNKFLALAGIHLLVWTILFATACVRG
jgi:1,4-dihydroxy-2-naphthoate octaprenyltransferase